MILHLKQGPGGPGTFWAPGRKGFPLPREEQVPLPSPSRSTGGLKGLIVFQQLSTEPGSWPCARPGEYNGEQKQAGGAAL